MMSLATIVTGKNAPDISRKRIPFGAYAMVRIGTTNSMKRRSVPAIAIKESNSNAGCYFMSLHTGRQIHSNQWEELPIDEDVIRMVEEQARDEEQPLFPDKYPMFEWAPGCLVDDDDISDEEE